MNLEFTPPVREFTPPVREFTPPVREFTPPVREFRQKFALVIKELIQEFEMKRCFELYLDTVDLYHQRPYSYDSWYEAEL